MLTVLTLHRVPTPSSLAILAKALKTLVYPLRSSGGSLRESQSVTFTFVHHITLYMDTSIQLYRYKETALRVTMMDYLWRFTGLYLLLREAWFVHHAYRMHVYHS